MPGERRYPSESREHSLPTVDLVGREYEVSVIEACPRVAEQLGINRDTPTISRTSLWHERAYDHRCCLSWLRRSVGR